ncbi:MAG TPA: phosphate signaling complex protein PhoU [Oscillospiraceae bacterium]|nr:phosphate signaling complex protein PhoU [Oscillospiraceae bacterium]HNW05215.1 phosphate signaling complex protein PhoU [Oscillospiraceae bacterium]
MNSRFDEQLSLLNRELIELGALCEEAIAVAAKSLLEGDAEKAAKVAPLRGEIEQKERSIESLCLKLILQQQPVARDLRQISAALKMITDMKRIGDQAADMADIIAHLPGKAEAGCGLIGDMARAVIKMVTESVDAFVKHDTDLAAAVVAYDDVVDDLFEKVKAFLIGMIAEKPQNGGDALDLLMIAKYFERIGDHAVNIAGWVALSLAGAHKEEAEL